LQGTITSYTRCSFATSLSTVGQTRQEILQVARILKVSTSPAGIKYKFGIQVPKGIKNAIEFDKKNGN
jgi:hypothetical protein